MNLSHLSVVTTSANLPIALFLCMLVFIPLVIWAFVRSEKLRNQSTPQQNLDAAKHAYRMAAQDVHKEMTTLFTKTVKTFSEEFKKHCEGLHEGEAPEIDLEKYLQKYCLTIRVLYTTMYPPARKADSEADLAEQFEDITAAVTISEVHISSHELPFLLEVKRFYDEVSGGIGTYQLIINHPDYSPLDQR